MDSPSILVIDDDREIRTLVAQLLRDNGYRVTSMEDGRGLMKSMRDGRYDLVILDLMLPGEDGLSLCRRLRAESNTPVIMLTARGDDMDRILGLEIGADDYLPKPFNPRELLARVRSVLRRVNTLPDNPGDAVPGESLSFLGWRLELATRALFNPGDGLVQLTSGEFDLLRALLERPGRVLSRDQLMDVARGPNPDSLSRSIDIQISRLRRKIEKDSRNPEIIVTVRNEGYLFSATVERRSSSARVS